MRLLDYLPGGNLPLWIAGAALAACAAFATMQTLRLADARTALASEKRDRAVQVARLEQAARQESERARTMEADWQSAQHENAILARKARDQAAADAAAADAAADRLRDRFAALAATCPAPRDPAAVAAGPAAGTPADLLADVFGRMDAAARLIAAYADAASISAGQCAADYQALRATPGRGTRKTRPPESPPRLQVKAGKG